MDSHQSGNNIHLKVIEILCRLFVCLFHLLILPYFLVQIKFDLFFKFYFKYDDYFICLIKKLNPFFNKFDKKFS